MYSIKFFFSFILVLTYFLNPFNLLAFSEKKEVRGKKSVLKQNNAPIKRVEFNRHSYPYDVKSQKPSEENESINSKETNGNEISSANDAQSQSTTYRSSYSKDSKIKTSKDYAIVSDEFKGAKKSVVYDEDDDDDYDDYDEDDDDDDDDEDDADFERNLGYYEHDLDDDEDDD